jgi:hypothetical protein
MDWNETVPGAKVAIAIVKLPAKVSVFDPRCTPLLTQNWIAG